VADRDVNFPRELRVLGQQNVVVERQLTADRVLALGSDEQSRSLHPGQYRQEQVHQVVRVRIKSVLAVRTTQIGRGIRDRSTL
jgi:hypothetical protein